MNVVYRSNQLRRCNEEVSLATRTWGTVTARLYRRRVQAMMDARMFEDLSTLRALRLHPLHGDRAGFFAIDLGPHCRLVVSRSDDSIVVEEVSNHYGD